MDPKNGQILDPKLKEAYDRVMGGSAGKSETPAHPTTPPVPPQSPNPIPTQASVPHDPLDKMAAHSPIGNPAPPPSMQTAATPATAPAPPQMGAHPTPAVTPQPAHATTSFSAAYVAPHPEKKSPVSGTLLIIAGVVFLIVYALFWMKWFGMAIPFLG